MRTRGFRLGAWGFALAGVVTSYTSVLSDGTGGAHLPSAARQEYACAVSLVVVLLIQPGSVQGLPHDTRACTAQCSSARRVDIPEIVHRVPCEVVLVGLLTPGGGL